LKVVLENLQFVPNVWSKSGRWTTNLFT